MTQEERRISLIRQLQDEDETYKQYPIPDSAQGQRALLRSLMNVRPPRPIGAGFLRVQDEYLTEEARAAGITDLADLRPTALDDRIYLWHGDITTLKADAIVNAANSGLCGCFRPLHNCVDNLIHSRSGIQLRLACNDIMQAQGYEEPTGQAKITPAYNLPCRYVLHTVGPIVQDRLTRRHEELLASCYRSCLALAEENGVESIAFCGISTGVFGFPKQRAAEIAVDTVRKFYSETDSRMKTVFTVLSGSSYEIYRNVIGERS